MSKKIGWIAMGLMLAGLSAPARVDACEIVNATLGCSYDPGCHRNAYYITVEFAPGCEDESFRVERRCGSGPWTILATNQTTQFSECAPEAFCGMGYQYRVTANVGGSSIILGPTTCN
ncbi:MAG: hypothetical protein IT349_18020 [Candidatus Eisenbacteria bacterium]|nr:hypothetical protein [Candidatus Eisenbacteria bacterium]